MRERFEHFSRLVLVALVGWAALSFAIGLAFGRFSGTDLGGYIAP
jgi:hypothetical protein